MPANVLIDTNLWIYSLIEADEDHNNHKIIISLLEQISEEKNIIISTQIIGQGLA